MSKRTVLYMLDPMPHNSPFDINMAIDAGFDIVLPFNSVKGTEMNGLTQDAIFSRGPEGTKNTGIFIGGRDIGLAMEMLEISKKAMVPPFQVSVMADPSGAFTTAAAMVAMVEKMLKEKHGFDLNGANAVVFGGTGPVGLATGVLAASCGANTTIVDHASLDNALDKAITYGQLFDVQLEGTCAASEADKAHLLHNADVVFCTAKAGVQVLKAAVLAEAGKLKVAADVNAVPPLGIEGLKRTDCGTPLKHAANSAGAVGIGALAIGDFKYKLQHALLKDLLRGDGEPMFVDFREAFQMARKLL
ncbi:NAD(P)-dependent methylenetetrahydromethanopterin dehydrogenase [Methylogaea oryzae]|uniref:Methylenetetrahydromethanopterin dehydrogenase n=1 Tax=Methylogaea oryzae TaxID=1295382 RepID=A0A8D4VMW5_9GAMM|nr:NAD(P)-dependent methylenetetrahydromethanopterin dehydrogenase [Methylogaea oryzae]BBL71123.1 methylenetetrahydromethanopterin dehydrogenase [Methylogaea oryzae]